MATPTQVYLNGAVSLVTSRQYLAALGKLFVVTNPSPGTAVAFANNVAYSATANGLWCISNNNPTGGATIQVDRLKLIQTAVAPANNLQLRAEIFNETGIVALTGTASARTPVNVNPGSGNVTGAIVTTFAAGAGTIAAAAGTRRFIGSMSLAQGVNIRYDSVTFEFGTDGPSTGKVGVTAVRATDPADQVCWGPVVTIAPQTSSWMNLWGIAPDTNVPSYEFALYYSEI